MVLMKKITTEITLLYLAGCKTTLFISFISKGGMDMDNLTFEEVIYLVTNIGFPMAVCVILLRYVLQTIGSRLDKLDHALTRLNRSIKELDTEAKVTNAANQKKDG